jgi:branched-chain amino acid transport system ATP-binding protein
VVKEIFQVLSRLSRSGLSVLLVEQNVQLSLSFVDYAYVVQQGRIALQGTPAELDGNEGVRKAYLGH